MQNASGLDASSQALWARQKDGCKAWTFIMSVCHDPRISVPNVESHLQEALDDLFDLGPAEPFWLASGDQHTAVIGNF